ncbi:hypothetical protein ACO2Q0_11975 [Phenylobacterium sp. VNQ135]|uniref:hypothetical protein n=1 Tax=Phenylobacterium sp. VNQ135 TaxID=3400922 RepID=UPI003C114CD7
MHRMWIAGGVLALGLAGAAAAQSTVADLMKHEINPAALAFWAAGNDPPENETPQAAQARWRAAEAAADTLRRQGLRLQAAPYARSPQWSGFARQMADAAASAEGAIRDRNAEAAFEAGGRLYDSCDGCHKAYPPPKR